MAVAIDDPVTAIGGLAHIFLPGSPREDGRYPPARYASTAVPMLVERVIASGAKRNWLRARLAGGAIMFPELNSSGAVPLGPRNVEAVRNLLAEMKIPVLAEDVGGHHGRSVALHLADGRMVVSSVNGTEIIL